MSRGSAERSERRLVWQVFDPAKSAGDLFADLLAGRGEGLIDSPVALCVREPDTAEAGVRTFVAGGAQAPDRLVCCRCPLARQAPVVSSSPPVGAREVPCRPRAAVPLPGQGSGGLILYQGQVRSAEIEPALRRMAAAASELSARIKLNRAFRSRFGRDCWLLGRSDHLLALDAFVRQAAEADLPVLLLGERGSGRSDAARLIHLLSGRCSGPFIRLAVGCLPRDALAEEVAAAAGAAHEGTLLLAEVNEMAALSQSQLAEILEQRLGRLGRVEQDGGAPDVRLVATVHGTGGRGVPELYPPLRDELAFLSFEIQPLAERPEDAEQLARYFLRIYGRHRQDPADETSDPALGRSPPRSLHDIRHSMARRAAFGTGAEPEARLFGLDMEAGLGGSPRSEPTRLVPEQLAAACAEGACDEALLRELRHPSVRRAVLDLAQRYTKRITLDSLARRSLTSVSHLSHLFKDELGLGPIAFVGLIRVERAKSLLARVGSLNLSEVARAAGFADLRLFERAFKRWVGMTPGTFRRQQSEREDAPPPGGRDG